VLAALHFIGCPDADLRIKVGMRVFVRFMRRHELVFVNYAWSNPLIPGL